MYRVSNRCDPGGAYVIITQLSSVAWPIHESTRGTMIPSAAAPEYGGSEIIASVTGLHVSAATIITFFTCSSLAQPDPAATSTTCLSLSLTGIPVSVDGLMVCLWL